MKADDWWDLLQNEERYYSKKDYDFTRLLVMADWFLDHDEYQIAATLRWMAVHKRMPSHMTRTNAEKLPACWWEGPVGTSDRRKMTSDNCDTLAGDVIDLLRPSIPRSGSAISYPTVREAITDLARVLAELKLI